MKIKPSKGLITVLGGALGLSLAATGGVLWVQKNILSGLRTEVASREAELADGHRVARRQEVALEELANDQTQLRYLETAVSDKAYVPTLLKQLEELAIRTQNKVVGVRPQSGNSKAPSRMQQRRDPEAQAKSDGDGGNGEEKEEKPEPYTPLEIQVTLSGDFKSAQAFVEQLQRFPKIIAVDKISLRPHQTASDAEEVADKLDIELRVTAFVMKETAPARPAATASAGTALARADAAAEAVNEPRPAAKGEGR